MCLPRGWSGFATTTGLHCNLGFCAGRCRVYRPHPLVEDESARGASTCAEPGAQLLGRAATPHAAPEDLVGRDQHDAYDEGHGEGADEALPDTGLSVLLLGMHCGEERGGRRAEGQEEAGERVRRERNDTVRRGWGPGTSSSTSPGPAPA